MKTIVIAALCATLGVAIGAALGGWVVLSWVMS